MSVHTFVCLIISLPALCIKVCFSAAVITANVKHEVKSIKLLVLKVFNEYHSKGSYGEIRRNKN